MRHPITSRGLALLALLVPSSLAAPRPVGPHPAGPAQARPAKVVTAGSVQDRAAQEAEAAASALEAVATRLEALAKEAKAAAQEARGKAIEARRRALAARKSANILNPKGDEGIQLGRVPGSILRAAEERESERARKNGEAAGGGPDRGRSRGRSDDIPRAGGLQPRQTTPSPAPKGIPIERDKHAAAKRTAAQNKTTYYGLRRAKNDAGPPKTLRRETMTFPPGQAPDMADLEIRAKWQWGINVARGKDSFQGKAADRLQKSGHIDLARLLIGPDKDAGNHGGMKWGMRRYNLGDSTVVNCDFVDIPLEHGIYDNLAGSGLYRGNTFHHLGGQAIQIAHRDLAYEQYKADNLPFRGKPLLIYEDNHAVDCGLHASKSGFTFTFFDYGSHEYPSTVILRNCTSVHAWDFSRTPGGDTVKATHPQAIRAPGGMVVHQYQHSKDQKVGEEKSYANEYVVIDNCLFDHTQHLNPLVAIRGTETILIEDSCFISRNSKRNFIDIDDQPGRPSRRVILENCVSPANAEVFLRIRGKQIRSLNCPGERIEIDVRTLEVKVGEPQEDPVTQLRSPLENRRPTAGLTPQPLGHVDDIARMESGRASGKGK